MRKYCRRAPNKKRASMSRHRSGPESLGKVKAKSFLSKKLPSRETLNQLSFLWSGYRHKFNFCFPIFLPTSNAKVRDWKHFSRKASFSPSSINCQTFFIIGMERRFFMPTEAKRKKANFCCFGVKTEEFLVIFSLSDLGLVFAEVWLGCVLDFSQKWGD